MSEMPKNDNEEIKSAICALKIQMFKGIALTCPKCNKKGEFGSIVSLRCETDNTYLICGWCGTVTLMQKVQK